MPRILSLCWLVLAPLSLPVLLSGCGPIEPHDLVAGVITEPHLAMGAAAVTVGSVAAIGRTPVDAAYSLITGKDCSVVRWDQGKTYCRPTEPPPDAPPYCTRSLGVVDCWKDPAAVPDLGSDVDDGPRTLTPAQEQNRTQRWPGW
jgi:hypothetical protein